MRLTHEIDDPDLLNRATELRRLLVTHDDDFMADAAKRQRKGTMFHGVVYGHQLRIDVGPAVLDLELMAKVYDPVDVINQVIYLPL